MLVLTAPAKTLDFVTPYQVVQVSQPIFLEEAAQINAQLKAKDVEALAKALGVSEKLAKVNFERFKIWQKKHVEPKSRPAILAYHGDIYQEMFPKKYSPAQQKYAQKSIRIVSAFYGLIKAYDLIQPYRLEMHNKVTVSPAKNLNDFWRAKLTKAMQEDIKADKHQLVLNLASEQYSQLFDFEALPVPVITVDFKEKKKDKLVFVAFFAKRARGMMMEYCIQNSVESVDQLKKFNQAGYKFVEQQNSRLLFIRG